MGLLGEEDIDSVLADLEEVGGTIDVTIAGVTVKGIRRNTDQSVLAGEIPISVSGSMIGVAVKTGALPGLAHGVAITVQGTALKVDDFRRVGNGVWTHIDCAVSGA